MVRNKGKGPDPNFRELFMSLNSEIVPLLEKSDDGKSLGQLTSKERDCLWSILNGILSDDSVEASEGTKAINATLDLLHSISQNIGCNEENDVSLLNILMSINGESFIMKDVSVRNNVSLINEYWMTKKPHIQRIPGMEYFTLKHLMESCLSDKSLVADLQRLNSIRKFITASPFETAVPSLKPLLMKLVQNQSLLNSEHGQRFLAHALILSQKLMLDIHKTIVLDVGSCAKRKAQLYAKVYVAAWQNAQNDMRCHVEKTCFQHMMESFLKQRRTSLEPTKCGQNLLSILEVWHSERKKKNCEFITMITDCYQPFIWKYLESGFNVSRCNAADLLFKAFPLQRPGDNVMDGERLFNQQFSAMVTGLRDDCHIVRIISVREVCNILTHYWNSFTPLQIQRLLTVISKEDAQDASSADVRRMVYVGFQSFLDNPLAFEYLSKILPSMADNIHDVNQKVRSAFVQLLLAIKEKGDPSFKYSEFVPVFSLYYRLAEDGIKVGELIVKLLLSNYYQENMPVVEWTKRFIFLIKTYPMAYRNFFLYSHKALPFSDAFTIIDEILSQIGAYVMSKSTADKADAEYENDEPQEKKGKRFKRSSNKKPLASVNAQRENVEVDRTDKGKPRECAFDEPNVVGGLFDVVTILWVLHDNVLSKPENQHKRLHLYETYIKYAQPFINYYKDTTLFTSILTMSGNIPASLLRSNSITLPGYCMKMLKTKKMDSTVEKSEDTLSMLIALIKWGKGSDVLEQVTLWLEAAFETQNLNSTILSRKRVKINETIQPNSVVAVNILDTLMRTEYVKVSILKKNYKQLFDLWRFMSRIKTLIEARLEQGEPFEDELVSDKFLRLCFKRYVKLIPLLKDSKVEDEERGDGDGSQSDDLKINYQQEIEDVMLWGEETLYPLLQQKGLNMEPEDIDLITSVYKDILFVADNMIILHAVNRQFYPKMSHLLLKLLSTDYCLHFVRPATRATAAINYSGKLLFSVSDELKIFSKIVPALVSHILNVLTRKKLSEEEMDVVSPDLAEVKTNLGKILETYHDNFKIKTTSRETVRQLQALVGIFVDAVVFLLAEEIEPTATEPPKYSSLNQLPPIASGLLSLFYNRKFWGSIFVHILCKSLASRMYNVRCLLASSVIFSIYASHDGKINKTELRKALCEASNLLTKAKAESAKAKESRSGGDPAAEDGEGDDADASIEPTCVTEQMIDACLELICETQVKLSRNDE